MSDLGRGLDLGQNLHRLGALFDENLARPHRLWPRVIRRVILVVLLHVRVGNVRGLHLVQDFLLREQLDHLVLGHPLHLGVALVAALARLDGQHVVADQAVEELLLLLDAGIAREHEGLVGVAGQHSFKSASVMTMSSTWASTTCDADRAGSPRPRRPG
jgi:hypothetical protein